MNAWTVGYFAGCRDTKLIAQQAREKIDEAAIREEFMAIVYDQFSEEATNDRANSIIEAFNTAVLALGCHTEERYIE